ncbi:MAG: peptidylprolyl isomerase [Parahaliea sp.]
MNIARIDGIEFSSEDLVAWLKLSGRFTHVVQDLIKEKMAAAAARKRGLTASPAELQERADQHRRTLDLHRAKDANEFLNEASLSLDQYEHYLEDGLLAEKLRAEICSDAAVEEYFSLNKPQFDAIELSHILVQGAGRAKEIVALLQDEPASFADIAMEQSQAESASEGGRIGRVMRGSMAPALESRLFNARVGEVLGPFEADADNTCDIMSITAKHPATLDSGARKTISKLLYNQWLESAAREFRVEI